jgi:hypothetical protein
MYIGGCNSCPHVYGYMEKSEDCDSGFLDEKICSACWDREIPGTEAPYSIGTLHKEHAFAVGSMKPNQIVINGCETIILKPKEIGIEVKIETFDLDYIDTININGYIFKKEN